MYFMWHIVPDLKKIYVADRRSYYSSRWRSYREQAFRSLRKSRNKVARRYDSFMAAGAPTIFKIRRDIKKQWAKYYFGGRIIVAFAIPYNSKHSFDSTMKWHWIHNIRLSWSLYINRNSWFVKYRKEISYCIESR